MSDDKDRMHIGHESEMDDYGPPPLEPVDKYEALSEYESPSTFTRLGNCTVSKYTTTDRSEWGVETLTHTVTRDEDGKILSRQVETDEETSKPFTMDKWRTEVLSSIEKAWESGERKIQISVPRLAGKSRLCSELQRHPSMLSFLTDESRVLVITCHRQRSCYAGHISDRGLRDPSALENRDIFILDDAKLTYDIPDDVPVIYIGTEWERYPGFRQFVWTCTEGTINNVDDILSRGL